MPDLIRDNNLKVTKALPAAGATNYSASIDLRAGTPGVTQDDAQLEVAIPALPSLADAKTATVTVQDSADDSTFADVPALAPVVLTGVSTSGAAAVTRLFPLPKDLRRFVRVKQVVQSAGGDNTAKSSVTSLVY